MFPKRSIEVLDGGERKKINCAEEINLLLAGATVHNDPCGCKMYAEVLKAPCSSRRSEQTSTATLLKMPFPARILVEGK